MLMGGCAARARPENALAGGPVQEGIASWYGPGFHGKRTTSTEVYDQHAMTAAHRTLPLNTRVQVTNLENGRHVTVRINDRGPFVGDRVIDLSYAAASALGVVGPGTAPVRLQVLGVTGDVLPAATYAVQVGSFADADNARQLQANLASRFERVYVVTDGQPAAYYRVRIGPFARAEDAAVMAERIRPLGLPSLVVEDGVAAR
jgi:rare lipoprotein A